MRRTLMLEIIGWYGAVAVLLAYALISFSLVSSTHWLFQVLNLSGAICLAGVAYSKKVYSLVVLNVVWFLIGLFTLVAKLLF